MTTFKPIEQFGKVATLLDVDLGTGRTHQIRVHAAHAGYPVAGDEKYGDREKDAKLQAYGLSRMFLHAASLTFRRGEEPFTATAPLPAELESVLQKLRDRVKTRPTAACSRALPDDQGTWKPCLRSTEASQISGRPTSAVGSCVSTLSNSEMPSASTLKPPALS